MTRDLRHWPPYGLIEQSIVCDSERKLARLERLYHVGQANAWDGRKVLDQLIAKHGPPRIDGEKREPALKMLSILLWGELAAWAISADLAERIDDIEAKMAATSQASDGTRDLCHFRTPTPSAQGSFCNSPDDCRSGLCDEDQSICVEPCDPSAGEAACAAGFTCQSSELADHVCREPEPAASCGVTPARSPRGSRSIALVAAALAAAALAARRIRRARSASTRS
jgi:hypothetical protein